MPRATSSSRNGTSFKVRVSLSSTDYANTSSPGWPDSSEGLKRLHNKLILYVPPLPAKHH